MFWPALVVVSTASPAVALELAGGAVVVPQAVSVERPSTQARRTAAAFGAAAATSLASAAMAGSTGFVWVWK
jgi:hypothetical protein